MDIKETLQRIQDLLEATPPSSRTLNESQAFLLLQGLLEDFDAGTVSDGYHTFNDLYRQRLVLTAALCNSIPEKWWKSKKHSDGEPCFDGTWFIVGCDTALGSYTYHYEMKDWSYFRCIELPEGKPWDGHTSKDVDRLLHIEE